MQERDIEHKLKTAVESVGGLCLKWVSPGFTGVPDRILLLPGGRIAFAELKAPRKTERVRQQYVQGLLRKLGFTVYSSVNTVEKIEDIIREVRQ